MKIVYSGGYNKYSRNSVAKSIFYRHAKEVNNQIDTGKVVASINFAKPDYYYDSRLEELFGGRVISINRQNVLEVSWKEYDIILVPGGDTETLKQQMVSSGFNINKLKQDVLIIGDSAGAYVFSKYYLDKKTDKKGIVTYYLKSGLFSKSNLLTVAHIDNKKHADDKKINAAKELSEKKQTRLLLLNENEEKLFDSNDNFKI